MIFCLGDGKYTKSGEGYQKHLRIFNVDVTQKQYEETLKLLKDNDVKIQLTKWVDIKNLVDGEINKTVRQMGGKLKVFSYEESWSNWWNKATTQQKEAITTLKWFDPQIFKEITGINITVDDKMDEAMQLLKSNGYKIVKE